MSPFTPFGGADPTGLAAALLSPGSGITIAPGSVALNASALQAVNYYDGSLAPLGIGAGLLLTSGTTPGTVNTMPWFGQDNGGASFFNGDADIDAVVNTVFQTQSYDATTLSFDFTVADPAATSVSFDLVFGSDEFPEWVDQFVDCAVVLVNGVNYALFNHDPLHPLSVVSSNLAAGYFQDNGSGVLPIEYDGVSHVLKIVAPIIPGAVNHIKIGIADTGDHIYDSGIFIANLAAGDIPGSGVVNPTPACDDSANNVTGTSQDEYFDLKGGDDVAYAGAGDDIVVAGAGNDTVYGGSGSDQVKGDEGDDLIDGGDGGDTAVYSADSTDYDVAAAGAGYTISAKPGVTDGVDTLAGVEFVKFQDGLFTFGPGATLVPYTDPATPPTNSPGTVFVTGFAADGQTLSATVSDPDGIPGAIAYQWESSADGGASWSPIDGATGSSYGVTAADAGLDLRVTVAYLDGKALAETLSSNAKTYVPADDGDFAVELIVLAAPAGASVMNPLTTLVDGIIALGISPNVAAQYVNAVLGIVPPVDLLHYDAWAALQTDPSLPPPDLHAFGIEKLAVQVAVLASLSGDQTGLATAQAIVVAGQGGLTLDLADAAVIGGILQLPADDVIVAEIADRNWNVFEAATVGEIEAVWTDILNGGLSTTLADLNAHINQPPTGFATAALPAGAQGVDYVVDATALLAGFSDADGGTLAVASLVADVGAVTDNGNGTFTIVPPAGYAGPVELTYEVVDGQGGSALAKQMFVVAQVDSEATGTLLVAGTAAEGATVTADATGIADPDGAFTVAYQWQIDGGGIWADIAGASGANLAIPDDQSYVGRQLRLTATTTDGLGGTTGFASAAVTVANVNDAPAGAVAIGGTVAEGQTLTASNDIADDDGFDPATIAYAWQADGATIGTGPTYTLTAAEAGKAITVLASYTDAMGTAEQVASAAVSFKAGLTVNGTKAADNLVGGAGNDILNGLAGNDSLAGLAGDDVLDGGSGADTMLGGAGDDTYIVDNTKDRVVEAVSPTDPADAGGIDWVQSSQAWTLGAFVENLLLTGTRSIGGTGNALDNVITGNVGKNVLRGGDGADTLSGGGGIDTLTGGAGADTFAFDTAPNAKTNLDSISDFVHVEDTIALDRSIFKQFAAAGPIDAANFGFGTAATSPSQYLVYDDHTGKLSYDADGNGPAAAVAFATLVGAPATVDYTDFIVIG